MPLNEPNDFTLEKLEIHKRLLMIEEYIREGKEQRDQIKDTMTTLNIRASNLEFMIHGNPNSRELSVRDGLTRRIEAAERVQKDTEKDAKELKGNFLKIALGAITLAVGAFVLWIGELIWKAVGK